MPRPKMPMPLVDLKTKRGAQKRTRLETISATSGTSSSSSLCSFVSSSSLSILSIQPVLLPLARPLCSIPPHPFVHLALSAASIHVL
ncbi:hypothetical protein VTJ04DRAFT_6877 [Mycothermus thermophilus]|uniref:uncharacterized protein n=1 Tax=Humicola insolens TaxID=85995 RepID=UPI0037442DA4